MGVIHGLKKNHPDKEIYLLSSGLVCPNMKRTTLQKIHHALENLEMRVTVAEPVRAKAYAALQRMLAVGR